MKVWAAVIIVGALASAGCSEPPAPPPPPAARTVPLGPTTPSNLNRPDEAKVRTDMAALRARVREYQMLNPGQNPPSLDALDVKLHFPADITYDPASGSVKSRTYPQY